MSTSVKSKDVDVVAMRAMLAEQEDIGLPAEVIVGDLLNEVERLRAEEAKRAPASAETRARVQAAIAKLGRVCEQTVRERDQACDELGHLQAKHSLLQEQFDELTSEYDRLDRSFEGLAEVFIEEGITQEGLGQLEVDLSERVTRMRKGLTALTEASGKLASVGITITRSRGVAVVAALSGSVVLEEISYRAE